LVAKWHFIPRRLESSVHYLVFSPVWNQHTVHLFVHPGHIEISEVPYFFPYYSILCVLYYHLRLILWSLAMKCINGDYRMDNGTIFWFIKALLLVLKDQFGILHCGTHHMIWLMQHSGVLQITYRTFLTSSTLVMLVSNGTSYFAHVAHICFALSML
jgi:hypothetical protein